MSDWLNVGKIVNTHGVRGEVRVISRTDFPEERYSEGSILHAVNEQGERRPLKVVSWRKHKQFDLLTFESIDSLNDAEMLKGKILQVDRSAIDDEPPEGEFYYHEIIGCEVFTESGEAIGKVKEILSPGANDVWVVQRKEKGKDILIPYIDEVVKQVKPEEQKVVINLMEGLLD